MPHGVEDIIEDHILRYESDIRKIALRYVGAERDAADLIDDVVSETRARAWENRGTFSPGKARAWLTKVAKNVCLDILRDRKQTPNWDDGVDKDPRHPLDRLKIVWGDDDDYFSSPPSMQDYIFAIMEQEVLYHHTWTAAERRRGCVDREIPGQPGAIYRFFAPRCRNKLPLSRRDLVLLLELAKETPREEIAKKLRMTRAALDMTIYRIKKRIPGLALD
jgi:RNA polymerase sigma factor (sigma-70 family)